MADRKTRTRKVQQRRSGGRKVAPTSSVHIQTRKERNAQIYQLHLSGKSNQEISDATGLHRNTITAAIRDMDVTTTPDYNETYLKFDKKSLEIQWEGMNCDDPQRRDFWAARWQDKRRLGGEAVQPGVTVNIQHLEEKREANLANALGKFGISVNVTG
jgi:transposase